MLQAMIWIINYVPLSLSYLIFIWFFLPTPYCSEVLSSNLSVDEILHEYISVVIIARVWLYYSVYFQRPSDELMSSSPIVTNGTGLSPQHMSNPGDNEAKKVIFSFFFIYMIIPGLQCYSLAFTSRSTSADNSTIISHDFLLTWHLMILYCV